MELRVWLRRGWTSTYGCAVLEVPEENSTLDKVTSWTAGLCVIGSLVYGFNWTDWEDNGGWDPDLFDDWLMTMFWFTLLGMAIAAVINLCWHRLLRR